MSLYRQCKISLIIFENYAFKYFFLVSTLNSIGGALCIVILSERLKMRKSLAINYWLDTISGVKVNNVIKSTNFEEFQLVLWFWTIFHFNTIFFNSSKIEFSKNLGVSTGLCIAVDKKEFFFPVCTRTLRERKRERERERNKFGFFV